MFRITPADGLPDVKTVEPRIFPDSRGYFSEVYNRRSFAEGGIDVEFVQDNRSYSRAVNTVRGLHFQVPPFAQAKLVRVTSGSILDVAVDIRHGSPTFLRHAAVMLSAENGRQLFVPVGFAHGFRTLEPDTEVVYKVSDFYSPQHESAIVWNDAELGIPWGVAEEEVVLSDKDRASPKFSGQAAFVFGQGC